MTPERTRKTNYENLEALAAIGQLQPGSLYFDAYNGKWYGATSNTDLFEFAIGSVTIIRVDVPHPLWQILDGETVTVADRVEYAIVSGLFDNQGSIELGDGSILAVIGG
jgi:hypothetical protein